jgi:hypothetical protein
MPDPHRCIGEPPRAGGGEHVASRSDRDPPSGAAVAASALLLSGTQARWFCVALHPNELVCCLCTVDVVPVDPELLTAARAAEARLIDAERAADIARADFHHSVRRLQLSGGSLREIADALGLSHQRVHQIVEGAGGARPWRRDRRPAKGNPGAGATLECSFCGKPQKQVRKLIAGPGVYICNECIERADRVIATGEPTVTPLSAMTPVGDHNKYGAPVKCSFCGKRPHQVTGLASAARVAICTECLALCHEIITEELA